MKRPLLVPVVAAALSLSCATTGVVRLPGAVAPSVTGRPVVSVTVTMPALGDLRVGDEVRRYLESEVGQPLEPASAGAALWLEGEGTFEELTLARQRPNSMHETIVLDREPAVERGKWVHRYRLRLRLSLTDAATGSVLWSRSFDRESDAFDRRVALYALYQVLEVPATELAAALGRARMHRPDQRGQPEDLRELLLP